MTNGIRRYLGVRGLGSVQSAASDTYLTYYLVNLKTHLAQRIPRPANRMDRHHNECLAESSCVTHLRPTVRKGGITQIAIFKFLTLGYHSIHVKVILLMTEGRL